MAKRKIITGLLILTLLFPNLALADDFVPEEFDSGTTQSNFILDSDNDAATSIDLVFGQTLNESLKWIIADSLFELSDDLRVSGQLYAADNIVAVNSSGTLNIGRNFSNWESLSFNFSNLRFELSDDLRVGGQLELTGTTITLDEDNAGAGANVSIIANQGSDNDGVLRYNATTNQWEISNDGGSYVAIGTGAVSTEESYLVTVDPGRTPITGILYNTLAAAISYINTQTPGSSNRFVIEVAPGVNTETVTIPTYTLLRGVQPNLSNFTGTITLANQAGAENITALGTGKVYVGTGNTAYLNNSDVILGDGSGGIDGNLVITRSFLDGQIDASGVALVYDSLVGVSSFVNNGTLGTYNSSVFNLTDNATWTNYGTAYDNTVLAAGKRLTSSSTQGAIDELIEGSPANVITLNKDETGNPDQDVDIVAEQGTENNGILRYDDGNNRWEYSNDGSTFQALGSVFGTYYSYAESELISSTTSITYSQKLRLTTPSLPAGTYRIGYSFEGQNTSTSGRIDTRVQIDDLITIADTFVEPQDVVNFYAFSGFKHTILTPGVHNIDIDFANSGSGTANIRYARLEIWRVQ